MKRLLFLLAAAALTALLTVHTNAGSASATVLTVSDFRDLAPTSGTFVIKGFISYIYKCPPCPPGALCKPCMPDNAIVSQKYEPDTMYTDHANHVVVLTPDGAKLTIGKQYELTVEVQQTQSHNFGLHDLKLLSSKPAEGE